jgi:hypothetical protein
MTEFRAFHDGNQETELFNVEVNKSANPFGDYAVLYIDDNDGTRFDDYPRGTKVTVEEKDFSEANSAFSEYFVGFVVERREANRASGDVLEVEAYTFDQFLRRNKVSSDQSGNSITTAMDNVITNDTPVTHVASNVTVANNKTLSRSYQGEAVETFLNSVSQKSGDEQWGVNSSIEFFFEPQETGRAPRDIDNTQWIDYDIPERGKRGVNQVRCWYDSGAKAVLLNDGQEQLEIKNKLGHTDKITFEEEISRPQITNRGDAVDAAKQRLKDKEPLLTGTVTTFGVPRAEPGDMINVTIEPRGIDDEFRIAENLTTWSGDSNQLTIVEKKGFQDDILTELATDAKRTELKDVDRSVTEDVIVRENAGAELTISGHVGGDSFIETTVTNFGLEDLRDGWINTTEWNISDMAVGDPNVTSVSRETKQVPAETETKSVTTTFPNSNTVRFKATGFNLSNTDIQFVGLRVNSQQAQTIHAAATFPGNGGPNVDITIDITVNNDTDVDRGVVTDFGQTAIRDIIGSNSPSTPSHLRVGNGTGSVSESDNSLDNGSISGTINSLEPISQRAAVSILDFGNYGSNETITEGGQADSLSGGNLFTRVRFAGVDIGSNQYLVARESVQFRNA